MAQVPQHNNLIIGGGKMATHWGYYLHSLGSSATFWNRSNEVKKNATGTFNIF